MPTATKKAKEPMVTKDSELLPVKLTEAEVTEFGRQMARRDRDLSVLETEKKFAVEEFKGKILKVTGDISDLAMKIRDGQEYRLVETETTYDLRSATSTTKRTDSGEVVRCNAMTPDQIKAVSQHELPFAVVDGGQEEAVG